MVKAKPRNHRKMISQIKSLCSDSKILSLEYIPLEKPLDPKYPYLFKVDYEQNKEYYVELYYFNSDLDWVHNMYSIQELVELKTLFEVTNLKTFMTLYGK